MSNQVNVDLYNLILAFSYNKRTYFDPNHKLFLSLTKSFFAYMNLKSRQTYVGSLFLEDPDSPSVSHLLCRFLE